MYTTPAIEPQSYFLENKTDKSQINYHSQVGHRYSFEHVYIRIIADHMCVGEFPLC